MNSTQTLRIIDVATSPSERLLRACAAFGLAVRHAPGDPGRPRRSGVARELDASLRPGQLAVITGPSGGGKSSLLQEFGAAAVARGERVVELRDVPDEPVIDVVKGPLGDALATLARAGLADATLLGRSASQLSEGERFRLKLAVAMSACGGEPVTVLIDEFASVLDRTTARCLCRAVRRWLERRAGVRVVVATAHSDVVAWLGAEVVVVVPLGGGGVEVVR